MVRVVLFSGGRGSGALARQLATHPGIQLSIVVNGYDDGASTGRVRRFLGDSLGPSDYRKNASRLARLQATCPVSLPELLDARLPVDCAAGEAEAALRWLGAGTAGEPEGRAGEAVRPGRSLPGDLRRRVADRLSAFLEEARVTSRPFDYSDCAVGNLVFAGGFLRQGRRFNRAIDDYCELLGLAPGLVRNVSDGANAWLVGLDEGGALLPTEEAIVDTMGRRSIREIFLLDAPPSPDDERALAALAPEGRADYLRARSADIRMNPDLPAVIGEADLIVYAPGTQHSSLFPSYLTRGLGEAVARNLRATKLFVTNLQPDAEIAGQSAVDLVGRAVFYLRRKASVPIPAPALLTHYIINDPSGRDGAWVPVGPLTGIDDPRLVRVGHFEEGVTGLHDGSRVLRPFVEAFVGRERRARVAVVLHDVGSANKLCQTLIEMVRSGLPELPIELLVVHACRASLEPVFTEGLPFPVELIDAAPAGWDDAVRARLDRWGADIAVLFDSGGMYYAEDVRALVSPILFGRSDVVWGSRRLLRKDIDESYRLRYRHAPVRGAVSFLGSYALSAAYRLLFGRQVTDSLSGVRALRYPIYRDVGVTLTDPRANHELLAAIFRARVVFHEAPIRFLPLSPGQVKRATVADGLVGLWTMVRCRFAATPPGREWLVRSVL